jgi:peptide chain release factor 1
MARPDLDPAEFVQLSKDYAELEPVVTAARAVAQLRDEQGALEAMLADPEMKAMAQEELESLRARLPQAEHALAIALLPKDAADARPAMLEIRAGTGGDEAALFAGDLLRMYQRYAETQGWRVEIISASASEAGGFKEVVASVTGTGVFARLKFESGVHRVQRVPVTESGGRIHTSAATVAVLPEAEEIEVDLKRDDLKIDTFRASSAGGQNVQKNETAVRITHLPTGLIAACQDERSQKQNRDKAMRMLLAHVLESKQREQDAEITRERKSQVGTAERSEKIRTYNYPQNRVTDHRVGESWHNLPAILEGDMEDIVEALREADAQEKLKAAGIA